MSEFLFDLVHSLSTSEKVYFKRFAMTHGAKEQKNYLKIYHAVEGMKSYDKAAFYAHFSGSPIEKHLSSEIGYLKEKLLLSQFNFNLNRSKRNQIQKGILHIEVLAGKGFRKEALKKLKTIKKSAYKYEEFTWILRLIELEEMILFKEGTIGYKDKLEELKEQRIEVTHKIQNLNNYHILRQEIRELQFSKTLITDEFEAFKELYNNPLVQSSEQCLSIRAKEHWYYIQVLINYLKREFHQGLSYSSEYVDFMFLHKHLFDQSKTLPALSNYIYHASLTKDKFHFELGQKILVQFSDQNDLSHYYLNYILYSRNLEFAYYARELPLMERYLPLTIDLLSEGLEHFEESQIQYLFMLIVRSAIVLKDFKMGTFQIHQWQQRGVIAFRKVQARLFSILIHYKLEYWELIQSEIVLLKKLVKEYPRERVLINSFYKFLNSYLKYPNRKQKLILKLQHELASLSQANKGYFDFISFDYHQWSLDLQ